MHMIPRRSAVYHLQAGRAEQRKVGRCMLAGDATHMMPPFTGAGVCTEVRDAVSPGWRLNAILEGKLNEAVLGSFVSERMLDQVLEAGLDGDWRWS